ncbi:hypothetical protein GLOIN_2v1731132 [Rhizophagus clarus]|uniref:Uncharacterized protein n=1 Tax=Rhizophagus clarus TaxID=94130 RepID=A0A8H3QEI2_9GLOM|nr:hypothetical protein GLOIN_2v1731132 [Rhizophagus clarus]
MNNFNNSTPDALSSSKAIMESVHDLAVMATKNLETQNIYEKLLLPYKNDQVLFQTDFNGNPIAIPTKISNIPTLPITTMPDAICFLYLKEEEKKETEKNTEINEPRDILASTSESVSKLDEYSGTSQLLRKMSNNGKCVLDDKPQKNNSSLIWSISYSSENGRQSSPGYDSKEQRFISFPTKFKWTNKPKDRELGLCELCGNNSLDLPSQVETEYSNQNVHNQCSNKKKR